jgi:hypothetical protein
LIVTFLSKKYFNVNDIPRKSSVNTNVFALASNTPAKSVGIARSANSLDRSPVCLGAFGALDRSTTSADALARSTPDDAARVAVVVVVAHRRAISRVVRRNMARVASTRASPCGASGVFRFAFGDREDEARGSKRRTRVWDWHARTPTVDVYIYARIWYMTLMCYGCTRRRRIGVRWISETTGVARDAEDWFFARAARDRENIHDGAAGTN